MVVGLGSVQAQQPQIRQISSENQVYGNKSSQLNLRIEEGKVWVNGNLLSKKNLPKSLRQIDERIFYQSVVFGLGEIAFSIQGREYLVKDNKVIELPSRSAVTANSTSMGKSQQAAMEDYYSNMKKEAPALFYSLAREAALAEQCRNLLIEFQTAPPREQKQIRKDLRTILDQLFDINEHNQQMEIKELQQMIDAAEQEVQLRKENKDAIIENTLEDLLGN